MYPILYYGRLPLASHLTIRTRTYDSLNKTLSRLNACSISTYSHLVTLIYPEQPSKFLTLHCNSIPFHSFFIRFNLVSCPFQLSPYTCHMTTLPSLFPLSPNLTYLPYGTLLHLFCKMAMYFLGCASQFHLPISLRTIVYLQSLSSKPLIR